MSTSKQRKKVLLEPPVKRIQTPKIPRKAVFTGLVVVAAVILYALLASHTHQANLERQLQNTKQQLNSTTEQYESSTEQNTELQKGIEELNRQKQELEKQLQAKKEQQARLAVLAKQKAVAQQPARVSVSGTCSEWIQSAGIRDVGNAIELIRRESGCNPNAVNRSSGACGIAQELPCGKSGCKLGDGACQVAWMNRYVMSRYGSWSAAVAHHNAKNWY